MSTVRSPGSAGAFSFATLTSRHTLMKFVDEAFIEVAAGNGGNGCVSVPPREVHALRRPERRRRRPGRQRLRGRRPQPQHAGRLPLRAPPSKRRNGEHGHGLRQFGAAGDDIVLRMPVGTIVTRRARPARSSPTCSHAGERVAARQGRQRRLRQPALQVEHQPRAAPEDAGQAWREAEPASSS